MAEEDRITLAPSSIYGRSNEEQQQNEPILWRRKPEKPPGKCLVYSLTILVIVFALCLIPSLIFLRVSSPEIEITSITATDLIFSNTNSSNPYFNTTLVINKITIRNSNFGDFEFGDSSLRVVYDDDREVVGETIICGRRVDAHKTVKITGVVVESSFRLSDSKGLGSDLRSGFLELRIVAEFGGRIKVMGRRILKESVMNCWMRLDLTGRFIHNLLCE